jgi:hypothetical protein
MKIPAIVIMLWSTVSSPSLVVNNANLDDKASYVCYAENSIGVGQSTSTVLNVLGGNVFDCLMIIW